MQKNCNGNLKQKLFITILINLKLIRRLKIIQNISPKAFYYFTKAPAAERKVMFSHQILLLFGAKLKEIINSCHDITWRPALRTVGACSELPLGAFSSSILQTFSLGRPKCRSALNKSLRTRTSWAVRLTNPLLASLISLCMGACICATFRQGKSFFLFYLKVLISINQRGLIRCNMHFLIYYSFNILPLNRRQVFW